MTNIAGGIERSAIDWADRLDLESAAETGGAESMAAGFGSEREVERCPADRTFETLIDFGLVVQVLIIDGKETGCSVRARCGAVTAGRARVRRGT